MLSQLVMAYTDGRPQLSVTPRDPNRSWIDFEDASAGQFVPRLGSQDLVRFAAFASALGMSIERFELADSTMRRLDSDLEERYSGDLKTLLRDRGQAAALHALDHTLQDVVVIGVKLVDRNMRAATLRRRGVLEGEDESEVVELLASAWEELRLS